MQWLVASALVLLFALVFNLGLLAYAMYVLLGVMLTSRVLAQTWARNVTARREWSALEAEIGDTIAVVIELENTGVRAYQAGDPLNRIHWHATARTGSLHSKIYEPSTVAGATVLMDLHQESHPAKDEPFRSELAVTAAASVANAVYEMGQQVGLVTNGRDAADRIRVEGWDFDPRTRQQARQSASMLERSERLQPVVVPTRRGSDQLRRILETLARVELTDGLQLHELILEAAGRMPRDATVITILPQVTTYTVVTLQSLKHRGFAVSAILNLYHDYDFAVASGPLQSIGVDTHHLKNEESISGICQRYLLR